MKKSLLKNFSAFKGKRLRWSLFLIGLQALRPAALLKRGSKTGVFWGNLQNSLFYRTPLAATFTESDLDYL